MSWKGHIQKMMTPLDALDEVARLISNEADYSKLKMWLDRAKSAGHVTMSSPKRTSLIDRALRANKEDPRMGSGKR